MQKDTGHSFTPHHTWTPFGLRIWRLCSGVVAGSCLHLGGGCGSGGGSGGSCGVGGGGGGDPRKDERLAISKSC